jgi:LppX_LprAFG lipoprotein
MNRGFDAPNPARPSRRWMLQALVTVGLTMVGCSLGKPAELSPADIMAKASDALKPVKSVHFKVSSTKGMMAIGSGLVAKNIEGDIVQPDRLRGKAISTFGRVTVEINFIIVWTKQFITNPITKKWESVDGASAVPNLLDPDKGASLLLRQVSNLNKRPNESIGGVDCYHLTGDVASSLVANLTGGTSADRALSGDMWIASSDFLLRQIHLVGPVITSEPPEIERVLEFSNFNQSVAIDPPT